jgi:hypothetical protein
MVTVTTISAQECRHPHSKGVSLPNAQVHLRVLSLDLLVFVYSPVARVGKDIACLPSEQCMSLCHIMDISFQALAPLARIGCAAWFAQ